MEWVRTAVFAGILLAAAVSDLKTREVANAYSWMIAIAALINRDFAELLAPLLGAGAMIGFFLLCRLIFKDRLGGADGKISIAAALFLGLFGALVGLLAGLALALSVRGILILLKKKTKEEGIPLVPYLAAGFLAAAHFF